MTEEQQLDRHSHILERLIGPWQEMIGSRLPEVAEALEEERQAIIALRDTATPIAERMDALEQILKTGFFVQSIEVMQRGFDDEE